MITLDYTAYEAESYFDPVTGLYHSPGSAALLVASINPDPDNPHSTEYLARDRQHLDVCFGVVGLICPKKTCTQTVIPVDLPTIVADWQISRVKRPNPTAYLTLTVHSPIPTHKEKEPDLDQVLSNLWREAQVEMARCMMTIMEPSRTFALFDSLPIQLHSSADTFLRTCGARKYPQGVHVLTLGKQAQPT